LKVIQLGHFDMILGYDWLAQFSPMKIHWGAKCLSSPYEGRTVVVQGLLSKLHDGDVVQLCQLDDEDLSMDTNAEQHLEKVVLPKI
jgi:hypothetical protein